MCPKFPSNRPAGQIDTSDLQAASAAQLHRGHQVRVSGEQNDDGCNASFRKPEHIQAQTQIYAFLLPAWTEIRIRHSRPTKAGRLALPPAELEHSAADGEQLKLLDIGEQ